MKILNKATTIIILLVGVILLLALVGPVIGKVEGFDENVPSCGKSDVPKCYDTLMPDDYSNYNADFLNTSDYILKTQIVTPVTPNCPIATGSDITQPEQRIETPESSLFPEQKGIDISMNLTPALPSLPSLPSVPTPNNTPTTASSTDVGTYLLNTPTVPTNKPPEPSNTCPPCPACERCPEPTVECKRVVNYGSRNTQLPVPFINDFSKIGRN